MEILGQEFWVPGSVLRQEAPQYLGKSQFKEILTPTEHTCVLYAERATQDSGILVLDARFVYFLSFNHIRDRGCHNQFQMGEQNHICSKLPPVGNFFGGMFGPWPCKTPGFSKTSRER